MSNKTQSRPNLKESQESSRQKIEAQIDKGYQLQHLDIRSEDQLKKAVAECKKWSDYNKTLLSTLFTSSSTADRYSSFHYQRPVGSATNPLVNPSLQEQLNRYHERVTTSLNSLEGIRDELELIPVQHSRSSDQDITKGNKVFVVHGRDLYAAETIARAVENLGLEVDILHEKPNEGRTIIKKLEEIAKNASYAIVLFTPDDVGALKEEADQESNPRARQNVIFELGFFIGKLGRKGVCCIYQGVVELPSDIDGLLYVEMDDGGAWKHSLAQEMESAGLPIDRSKL